jgi:hypothetical protein
VMILPIDRGRRGKDPVLRAAWRRRRTQREATSVAQDMS